MNTKKSLSVLLTLALILALLPWSVLPARATVTGSGTEGDPFVVDNWADLKEKMAAGGYIRLGGDVTDPDKADDSYLDVPAGVTVTLDLAGYTVDRGLTEATKKENGYVIKVSGALTVDDSSDPDTGKITGGYSTGGWSVSGGGVYVPGGALNLSGGAITGNTTTNVGGGVYASDGTIDMSGGTISNNTATNNAGGVCVSGGTFNMSGGSITGNTTSNSGGGVYAVNNAVFAMSGGSVTGNTAADEGGGIYVYQNASFRLSGAVTVTGNTKDGGAASNVCLHYETLFIISGPLSAETRIGVTVRESETITDGLPGNGTLESFTSDDDAYGL